MIGYAMKCINLCTRQLIWNIQNGFGAVICGVNLFYFVRRGRVTVQINKQKEK